MLLGKWNSANYWDSRKYICQRWPAGAPTAPPEADLTGGCPENWHPYKNRCFQFNGLDNTALEDRRTWEEAKNYCDAQQPGMSTLAVVPAQNYNEFIFSHMMSTNNNGSVMNLKESGLYIVKENTTFSSHSILTCAVL